jgi:hypothetical protein
MTSNSAISASDLPARLGSQAVEKLTAKLQKCKESQAHMKDVNAYYRKFGTCNGYPEMPDTTAAKLDLRVEQAYSWNKQPFPSYELTNNNAEIRRLEGRIKDVTRHQEIGFSGWEFEDGSAETNTELDRLQLFFDNKPDEHKRAVLKANGFKWAPSQGAWQRQLTDNAIYAAGRIDFIKPSDGRTVRECQPKRPNKDTGTR